MRQLGERKPTHNAYIVVIATRLKAEFASGNRAPRRDRDEQRRMMQFGVARACVTAHVGADPAGAPGKPKRLAKDRKSVVSGKRVAVRVDLGGRRIIKKKKITYDEDKTKRTTIK